MKKITATLGLAMLLASGANAGSVSFDSAPYSGIPGDQIIVTINYDFTDIAMFGGGFNLLFDANVIDLVSYTRADHSGDDAQDPASPVGAAGTSGEYLGFGVGTFEFFNGMTDAGQVGTFVFDLLAPPAGAPATPCGQVMCMGPNEINPMVSLAGVDLTADFFPENYIGAAVDVSAVPIPAAAWLFGSALLGLGAMKRRKA